MKHSFLITRGDLYVCVDQDVVSRSPGSGRPCGDAQTGILALAHAAAHRNLQGRHHTVLLLLPFSFPAFPCRRFTYSYLQVLLLVPLLLLPVLLSEPPLPLAPACALRCNRAVLFLARPSCMSFHMIT